MNKIGSWQKMIMRRIYAIWFFRRVVHSAIFKFFLLLLLFWQIQSDVSWGAVWRNAETAGGLGNYRFFWSALTQTETAVQTSLFFAGLIGLWLVKDLLVKGLWPRLGFSSPARL